MSRIQDKLPQDRPREKLRMRGAHTLSDQELLSVLLGSGTIKHGVASLSRKVLRCLDRSGADVKVAELESVEGIGLAKASLICAAFELCRRRLQPKGVCVTSPDSILRFVGHYAQKKQEHFICITLNGASELISVHVISIGILNRAEVHPREVFAEAIKDRAAAIIVAHNHPSHDVQPSKADREVTQRLRQAGELLGIPVLDHVIFNQSRYYSFRESGEW